MVVDRVVEKMLTIATEYTLDGGESVDQIRKISNVINVFFFFVSALTPSRRVEHKLWHENEMQVQDGG